MEQQFFVQDPSGHFRPVTPEDFPSGGTVPSEVAASAARHQGDFLRGLYEADVSSKAKAVEQMGNDIGRLAEALEKVLAVFQGQASEGDRGRKVALESWDFPDSLLDAGLLLQRPDIAGILDMYRFGTASDTYNGRDVHSLLAEAVRILKDVEANDHTRCTPTGFECEAVARLEEHCDCPLGDIRSLFKKMEAEKNIG